jgi:hypothetical protein
MLADLMIVMTGALVVLACSPICKADEQNPDVEGWEGDHGDTQGRQ